MSTTEVLFEFRNYVLSSGVNFDVLSDEQKGEWRGRFDNFQLLREGYNFIE
jgi:hypothetical protein